MKVSKAPLSPASANLLRLTTAGSVDDGKSTLIGRLLYDTKSLFDDQMEAVEEASRRRGEAEVNLALFTDGLRAEREQNITIDVAYRYFATPKRRFIIADTPGHIQYTRNMVTGASTAELAIVLIDARNGVLTQSKRHGFIASLLGIPHVVVAVNKMDLVDWSQDVFDHINEEYTMFSEKLGVQDLTFIPISALRGDNVVEPSGNMPWYDGGTLLHLLEHVHVGGNRNLVDFRFPVQYVIRPHQDFRGFAGRVASGTITPGEEVVVLPSGRQTRIQSVESFEGQLELASALDSVVLTTEDEIDISRGDMIVRKMNLPTVGTELDAIICWLSEAPMQPGTRYWLMHTTRSVRAFISRLVYRIDVDTLHREAAEAFELNDIGRVQITTAKPIFYDPYRLNRVTGSFILIDPDTNNTVAAGMIQRPLQRAEDVGLPTQDPTHRATSPNVVWESLNVSLPEREARNRHKAAVLWFTGLSGAGKSSVARALERRLYESGCQTMILDGDQVRHGLNGDLGFTPGDRQENIRRVGEVASLLFSQGVIVLCTFISPFQQDRDRARALIPKGRFFEIFVDCDLDECIRRDPKGLYRRALRGEMEHMTGISSPYEAPDSPEIHIRTDHEPIEALVERIAGALDQAGIVGGAPEGS